MEIHKNYIIDEHQKTIAVQIPIAEWEKIEKILQTVNWSKIESEEDAAWLNSDLSSLGECEPYEWEPGELGAGKPVTYIDGVGLVVEK